MRHSKLRVWRVRWQVGVWTTWLLATPVAALLIVFFIWPLLDVASRSLNVSGRVSYRVGDFSLTNYAALFTSPALREILRETFVIAVLATAVTVAVSFPVAYLLSRLSGRLAGLLLLLVMTPFWVSILVRLFATTQILGRQGLINDLAERVGLGPWSMLFNTFATVVGMTVYLVPYMVLMLYAGMSGIDSTVITAARTLGASRRRAFLTVYLPQLRPTLAAGIVLVFVLSLGFFLTPAILGGPENVTIATFIQQQVNINEWGIASAAGVALLLVTLLGYFVALRLGGKSMLAAARPAVRQGGAEPLPRTVGTVALWVFSGGVILLLLVPLLVVIPSSFDTSPYLSFPPTSFTTDWYAQVVEDSAWRDPLIKSLQVALGAAGIAAAGGLMSARLVLQLRSQALKSLAQAICYAPLIVPAILLAIGVYDTQIKMSLDGSRIGLMLAHAVIALPFTFAILVSALSNLDTSLEQASRSLGASRIRAFFTVVLPNIRTALLGAILVGFVTSWDEVVIALFQSNFEPTLPVAIYSLIKSGVTPAVSAVATLLIAVEVLLIAGAAAQGPISRWARQRRHRPVPVAAEL